MLPLLRLEAAAGAASGAASVAVGPEQPPGGHATSTAERGSFCLAICSCGWTGPARRSRDLARKDATRHTAE
ncbi:MULTISPECIES: hypothetical protein [unclassified Streptomyces]|uniref:hypothetical protein n=1 Tax=unclassified Streptomyces TaxID=2593676 RepID=UPI001BE9AA6F|nr:MULTISPECIES: hypothetical protein [unclassified Streptomyces]MBT2405278.1 hypothetical protein [Streptomyces sp. ISL-21]MBT2613461.1 hypothetical protein [Streptomyces sp. ISL-87]